MTSRAAATRYARALFDVAVKEADPERVGSELTSFGAMVSGNQPLHRALVTPSIPPARKRAIVEALLGAAGDVSAPLAKLLLLLADRDRLVLIPELAEAYRERLRQHQHVVLAEVVTAIPLPPDRRAALEKGIAEATRTTVLMSTRVDPAIIGGAVTRIGSTVYDGSVARQLERLRERLTGTA
jgi:F-type H+-transporting ATPase subunit delta